MAIVIPLAKEETAIVDEVLYNRGYLYFVCLIVALGGVLFGFDMVIISGALPFFVKYFHLNEAQTGWAVGCINLGAAAGALMAGKLSATIGRKRLLIMCAFLFAITGIGTGWTTDFNAFIFARLLSGVAVGAAALVCPMYIAEVAPKFLRGRLVTFYQLAIVTGLLLAYFSNYVLLDSGENNWRWMFTSQTIPSLFFLTGLFFVPESPRWLIKENRMQEALAILSKIGGNSYASFESIAIKNSFLNEIKEKFKDLWRSDVRRIVFIGAIVAIVSRADGQNSLFSYAPVIFKQAGMTEDAAFLQAVILGVVNFIFTFVAIKFIDQVGRKKLLLYGSSLLCLDALALAYCFYAGVPGFVVLIFVLGFIGIYAATLGPVTWVLLSEIFPNRVRGSAMAVATLSLWIANFFTTASFPILQKSVGLHFTFVIHAAICFFFFLFVMWKIPETNGKSLEEIEVQLTKGGDDGQ